MALLIEIVFFGVLPLAFALWQIMDVRREQRRRQRDRERRDHGTD
jgi:hypothetical protein